MSASRGADPIEVELVEQDGAEAPREPGPSRRRRRHLTRWVGLGVVAVLVAVVAGVNVTQARVDAAQRQARAALPWVAPSLAEPVHELWRASGAVVGLTEDHVLLAGDRSEDLSALDPATGEVVWRLAIDHDHVSCFPLSEPHRPVETILCLDSGSDPGAGAMPGPARFYDAATGEPTGVVPLPGRPWDLQSIAGDLLLVTDAADGSLTLLRVDPAAAAVTWASAVPTTFVDVSGVRVDPDGTAVQVDADPPIWLDGTTGRPLDTVEPDLFAGVSAWGWGWDGAAVAWRERTIVPGEPTADVQRRTQVRAQDGSVLFTADGMAQIPYHDDELGPDVLVLLENDRVGDPTALVGVDGATGNERWRADTVVFGDPCLQTGELLVLCGGELRVWDVRAGGELWRLSGSPIVPVTDGRRLLVADRAREPGSAMAGVLAAHDLRTGAVLWQTAAPPVVLFLEVVAGVIVAWTPDGVVAFG